MLTFSSSGQEPVSYLVELFEQTVQSSVLIFQEFTDDLQYSSLLSKRRKRKMIQKNFPSWHRFFFFIAFFGVGFCGHARLIYDFFNSFSKVHHFLLSLFSNNKIVLLLLMALNFILSPTSMFAFFFLSLLVIRLTKLIAFLAQAMKKKPTLVGQ